MNLIATAGSTVETNVIVDNGENGIDVIRDFEGVNHARLEGFGETPVEGLIVGKDLIVVANKAAIFKVENYVGNEQHFAGVQRGDSFFEVDDILV